MTEPSEIGSIACEVWSYLQQRDVRLLRPCQCEVI